MTNCSACGRILADGEYCNCLGELKISPIRAKQMNYTCKLCNKEISLAEDVKVQICYSCRQRYPKEEYITQLAFDSVVENIYATFGLTEPLSKEFIVIVLKMIRTFDKKQHDYGSHNIADFGEFGVLVRANDKIRRLKNLLQQRSDTGEVPLNESLDDTWLDLAVYSVIALMCRKGVWK